MVIYLPVCSASLSFSQPESSPDLALWDIFSFQCNFFPCPFYLLHFDLKHSDWWHWLFCVLLWVWYSVGHVWVFMCGIDLASNLTAFRCVFHWGLCLHTSNDVLGTGLSVLHNWCWLCPESFKQLLVISPQRPRPLDEWTGRAMLTFSPLRTAITVWETVFLSISSRADLRAAFCVVCPVSNFSFYLSFHLEGLESAKCWSRTPSFPTVLVSVFIYLTLFLAHTGV